MKYEYKKIFTSNPFADHVIWQAKNIAMNSLIKDENLANEYETVDSAKNFERFRAATTNHFKFYHCYENIPYEVLKDVLKGKYYDRYIRIYAADKDQIPVADRDAVTAAMKEYVLKNYEERNDYYRELCGYRPSYSKEEIDITEYGFENNYQLQNGVEYRYLHELPESILSTLYKDGTIDRIANDYPDEKWIPHIKFRLSSDTSLTPYTARMADHLDLLYMPEDADEIVRDEFAEKYALNREYVLSNIYSEAFKLESDYYDNFIQVLIIIMTLVDMMDTISDHIVRKDIFDARCIQYIFEQYGVPYYDEIPLKYQYALMKNLNTLLKFKSTAKCMIDICSLFGFDSSQIFQFYLLKKRRVNERGDYIFNYKNQRKPKKCAPTTKTTTSFSIEGDEDSIEINPPFYDYFSKGNIVVVYLDETILPEEYYIIMGNKIFFLDKDMLKGHNSITIKYVYDENETIEKEIPDLHIDIEKESLVFTPGVSEYEIHPPTENYFESGSIVKVIVGSLLLNGVLYDIDQDTNTLKLKLEGIYGIGIDDEVDMQILYLFSNTIKDMEFSEEDVLSTEPQQRVFKIPVPFEKYLEAGSTFFVTLGGAYVPRDKYHVSNGYLYFNYEEDYVEEGNNLTFHFVFNRWHDVELKEVWRSVVAEQQNQLVFDIPVPYESYLEDGGFMMPFLKGNLVPNEYYTITKNTITLDSDIGIYIGGTLDFLFIYGDSKVKHTTEYSIATIDYQQDFPIPFPYEGYLDRGNKFRVFVDGVELVEGEDFRIRDGYILEIYSTDKSVRKNNRIRFDFYSHEDNENQIKVTESTARVLKDDQDRFVVNTPFFNYFQTGNQMLVTIGSVFLTEDQYELVDDRIRILDPQAMDLLKDRNLVFIFIYHSACEKYDKAVTVDTDAHQLTDEEANEDGSLIVKIPFPFEDYLELGNEVELRVDGTHLIPPSEYDIINNDEAYIYDARVSVYPYGSNIQFVFIYTASEWEDNYVEDLDKDVDLKFVKVPILQNPDSYIKDDKNYLDYDSVTLADESWDGDYIHEQVKSAIINREFSYNRTKYFSITNIASMGGVAYQLPYFMNIILDEVKSEERLTLNLPFITDSHSFRFNDVLTYMMALSHRYIGIDDEIPTIQKALYIKGFNFQADLATIGTYIQERLKYNSIEALEISDRYKNFAMCQGQVPTYKELIQIYTTNTDIYNHVVHEMLNAENKMVYDCYKKIYDSLLIEKESKKYFTIGSHQCDTITEWLKNRDQYLYDSLMNIDNIKDETEKKIKISQNIDNCVYQISEFVDSEEFRYLLGSFAGGDQDAIVKYLTKVIGFFKSYKIKLYDVGTQYVFDDKLENTIRPIDQVIYNTTHDIHDDGHSMFDAIYTMVSSMNIKDKSTKEFIREQVLLAIKQYLKLPITDKVNILDYIDHMLISVITEDKIVIPDKTYLTTSITAKSEFVDSIRDILKMESSLTLRDRNSILESITKTITQYLQLPVEDNYTIDSDLESIKSKYSLSDDLIDRIKDIASVYTRMTLLEHHGSPVDTIGYFSNIYKEELIKISDRASLLKYAIAKYFYESKVEMSDEVPYVAALLNYVDRTNFKETVYVNGSKMIPTDYVIVKDNIAMRIVRHLNTICDIAESVFYNTILKHKEYMSPEDIAFLHTFRIFRDEREVYDRLMYYKSIIPSKDSYRIGDSYLRTQFTIVKLFLRDGISLCEKIHIDNF